MQHFNISFVGAGKVATVLVRALFGTGHNIVSIVSRDEVNGNQLASSVNSRWSPYPVFDDSTDVVIVSVGDSALQGVVSSLECGKGTIVVHTAGSFGLEVFPDYILKKGVFYPLQTFSKERKIDFSGLPFLLEAENEDIYYVMEKMVCSLGSRSYRTDRESRRLLHVTAVFACNFINHMLGSGKKILDGTPYDFDILEPLVKETVAKAFEIGPENSQTGPAYRNDKVTMNLHEKLLSFDPDLKRLYKEISRSIVENHN